MSKGDIDDLFGEEISMCEFFEALRGGDWVYDPEPIGAGVRFHFPDGTILMMEYPSWDGDQDFYRKVPVIEGTAEPGQRNLSSGA